MESKTERQAQDDVKLDDLSHLGVCNTMKSPRLPGNQYLCTGRNFESCVATVCRVFQDAPEQETRATRLGCSGDVGWTGKRQESRYMASFTGNNAWQDETSFGRLVACGTTVCHCAVSALCNIWRSATLPGRRLKPQCDGPEDLKRWIEKCRYCLFEIWV